LKPVKDEARLLEGTIGSNHGAIWQVLPAYERLLTHFESLRQQYPLLESIPSQEDSLLTTEHHFSININLAWQKLDEYYTKTDDTPLYVTAVVLHPRFKRRWFENKWKERADWLELVDDKVNKVWQQYKDLSVDELKFPVPKAASKVSGIITIGPAVMRIAALPDKGLMNLANTLQSQEQQRQSITRLLGGSVNFSAGHGSLQWH
jgi:hypothetical protein